MAGLMHQALTLQAGQRKKRHFVMTVRTTGANETFQWPNRTGTRNARIYWGDGTWEISTGDLSPHTYVTPGDYDIRVEGAYTAPQFSNGGDRLKALNIKQWGNVAGMTDWGSAFYGCAALDATANDAPALSGSLGSMFRAATAFNGDVSRWNTTNVTSMSSMFRGAAAFNADISQWSMANVNNTSFMFTDATLFNADISQWNMADVTNMSAMFRNARDFNAPIGNWNTANVSNMSEMFRSARDFNRNLSGWCVTLISTEPEFFKTTANAEFIVPVWGTCPGA